MAFVPIDAKADIQSSKKGKLTPAQHAQLNAWCLASKTGIFDCLGKCEATEQSYSVINNIATVIFKKGYLVICGRFVECEENTKIEVTAPNSGSVNGKIVARFDLAQTKEGEFSIITKADSLVQQDLNDNTIGTYEFELYSYTITPSNITLTRNIEYIPDIGGKLVQFEESLTAEGKPLGGYNTSKGTIEERLTRLGFNSVPTSYNFGMEKGTVKYNSGTIKTEGRFGELVIDYGTDSTDYQNQRIFATSQINAKTVTSTISKPSNIPSGLNISKYVTCETTTVSQGGTQTGTSSAPCVITTNDNNLTISITFNKTSGNYSIFYRRINGRVLFSWSDKIVL